MLSAVCNLPDVPYAFLLVEAGASSSGPDCLSVVGKSITEAPLRWLAMWAHTWSLTTLRVLWLSCVVVVGQPLLSMVLLVVGCGSPAMAWASLREVRASTVSSLAKSLELISPSTVIMSLRLEAGSSSLNGSRLCVESSGGIWALL